MIIGKQKLTTDDDLPMFLQEYVLHLASIYALEFLKNKFASRFLKNDVSMTEIIAAINTHRQRVAEKLKAEAELTKGINALTALDGKVEKIAETKQ